LLQKNPRFNHRGFFIAHLPFVIRHSSFGRENIHSESLSSCNDVSQVKLVVRASKAATVGHEYSAQIP